MRRQPLACRRAVQSLQPPAPHHIWISDEQLSVAVNRFFQPPCPHQKRHGSHVPGPLEARRRAAKRRMTVSANMLPQDSFPPPFSLGALFGFHNDPQPSWRYEPPSLPQNGQPLAPDLSTLPSQASRTPHVESTTSSSHPFRHGSSLSFTQSITKTALAESTSNRNIKNASAPLAATVGQEVANTAEQIGSHVADAEACLETFKALIAYAADLSPIDRNRLLGHAFRACCPSHSKAYLYSVMVVKHLMERKWDPAPLFRRKFFFAIPPTYTTESRELLGYLEQISLCFPQSLPHFHRLYLRLAEEASHAETSMSPSQDSELLLLIRQLWQSACAQSAKIEDSAMDILQTVASKLRDHHYNRPLQSILANITKADHHIGRLVVSASEKQTWFPAAEQVLSCLPQARLTRFVPSATSHFVAMIENKNRFAKSTYKHRLSTWLKLLHRVDTSSMLLDLALAQIAKQVFAIPAPLHVGPDLLLDALLMRLSQKHASHGVSSQKLSELITSFTIPPREHGGQMRVEDSLVHLFSRMKMESLPYQDLAEAVVALIVRHADLGLILRFLTAMEQQQLAISDFSALDRLIAEKVAAIQQRTRPSAELQHQHDAFALRTCQRIFEVLGKIIAPCAISSPAVKKEVFITLQAQRQFEHIMNRARANRALPLAYHDLTTDMTLQQRVDLIHQLAHYYSLDTTRSYLENCRAVNYLYQHLRKNSLSIGPLFTKAVVRVSLTRPLIENRFVSAKRLIWVCQLVASVEGEEVAKRIENDFWLWRGDLIRYAKSVYVSVGGDFREKAHIGTMKKLGLI